MKLDYFDIKYYFALTTLLRMNLCPVFLVDITNGAEKGGGR